MSCIWLKSLKGFLNCLKHSICVYYADPALNQAEPVAQMDEFEETATDQEG